MATESTATEPQKETCISCGAKLKGDYCRKCGEKRIVPDRDFSVSKFMTLMFGHVIHFDSKLVRTYWLLCSKPGFLTLAWIEGRRVKFMKPLQLFVITSIAFYFFLPTIAAYFSSLDDLIGGYDNHIRMLNLFQVDIKNAMIQKAGMLQTDVSVLEKEIVREAARQSKTWLFLIIPCWGTMIYVVFRNKINWLVPHLVFAMHAFTFYILSDLLIHFGLNLTGLPHIGKNVIAILALIFFPYLLLALRRVYGDPWHVSLIKAIILFAALFLLLMTYKQIITFGIFWLQS
jgi:hypothetical protein